MGERKCSLWVDCYSQLIQQLVVTGLIDGLERESGGFRLIFERTVIAVEKIRRANSRWWTGLSVLQKRAWMEFARRSPKEHSHWRAEDIHKRWGRSPTECRSTRRIDGSVDNCSRILRSTSSDWRTHIPQERIWMSERKFFRYFTTVQSPFASTLDFMAARPGNWFRLDDRRVDSHGHVNTFEKICCHDSKETKERLDGK